VTLQRLAIAVFLAFGLSACDAPQFRSPIPPVKCSALRPKCLVL
jgi:hypothetical protein